MGPGLAPAPKVILTTGSPRLPVQSCAFVANPAIIKTAKKLNRHNKGKKAGDMSRQWWGTSKPDLISIRFTHPAQQ